MFELLLVWLCVSVSLIIVSKLSLGLEIDDFVSAFIAAIAIGIVNALIKPIIFWLTLPLTILTLGLFALVVNGIALAIAAALVSGFRVKGLLGAIIGSIALSLVNLVISRLVGIVI